MRCKDLANPKWIGIIILVIFATGLIAGKDQQVVAEERQGEIQEPIWRQTFAKRLKETVSYSFEAKPLKDVLETFRKDQRLNIILDTKGRRVNPESRITLHLKDVRFESALSWTVRLAGLDYAITHQAIFISRRENMPSEWRKEIARRKKKERIHLLQKFLPALQEKFIRPVTLEISEVPINDALAKVARIGDVNIIYLPDSEPHPTPVAFKIEKMTLENAFKWLLRLEGLDYLIIDEAVVVGRPSILARWKPIGLLLEGLPPLARVVPFDFRETPLRQALEELSRKSGVIIYIEAPEEVNPPVTAKSEDTELLDAVQTIVLKSVPKSLYLPLVKAQKDAIYVFIGERKLEEETVPPALPEEALAEPAEAE